MEVSIAMGNVGIIARRLSDTYVQYGWSGNGGYFRNTGWRLLRWYQSPEDVEYLFGLGQTRHIGKVGSEKGGYNWYETHEPTGDAFWVGRTEREIFSKICFVEYGYFYDSDHKWYYIKPGPFSIKMPLELVANNIDDRGFEFDYLREVKARIARFIFDEYAEKDIAFASLLKGKGYESKKILEDIIKDGNDALYELYDGYREIFNYFDDWILLRTDSDCTEIEDIIMHRKSDIHIETYMW